MRRHRSLQRAIEDGVSAELLRDFNLAIIERKCRVRFERDEDGEYYVTWDDEKVGGIPPSDELVWRSMQWLADRRDGTPAQSIHLAAHLQGQQDEVPLAFGVLPASTMFAIRTLVRGLPAPTSTNDAIDAEVVSETSADGVTTPTSQHDSQGHAGAPAHADLDDNAT